jgi:hypothetical protein
MTKPSGATRWLSRPAGGDTPEDRLADLMRAAAPSEGLGAAARDRVWTRLTPRARERRAAALPRLRWSVALGLLLTSSVVVGGVSARRWWPALKTLRSGGADAVAPAAPARARAHARVRVEPEPLEAAPLPEPSLHEAIGGPVDDVAPNAPALAPSLRRAPSRAQQPEAAAQPAEELAPTPVAAPAPSALANETALLGVALARLRQQRDAAGALAALDAYDARVPHGTLRREADAARADALLMMGRDADALALLRTLALGTRGRDQELRVVRGELNAATSCARAVADFDAVLAAAPPPALAERAVQGRAACLARMGGGGR